GASREVTFSTLAEPALLLALAAIARKTGSLSLSTMLPHVTVGVWAQAAAPLALVALALLVVFLAENGRIPVDDPATHLELTMIHEVMVLDHGGTVLACIVLTSFVLLGSSRLGACIRVVAFQGILLGFLTLAARQDDPSLRAPILALVSTGLKGVAFPWLLFRALRDANVRREVEP